MTTTSNPGDARGIDAIAVASKRNAGSAENAVAQCRFARLWAAWSAI